MIKILIADDEYMEREALAEIAGKRFGTQEEIRLAVNGRQAVDIGAFWCADVALLDIEMPGLNGLEAAKQILAQSPECKLIFITAYGLFTYAQEAVKLGACDYILKPPEDAEVEAAICRAIGQTETQRQRQLVEAGREKAAGDKIALMMSSYESTGHFSAAPYVLLDEHCRLPELQIMSTVALDRIAKVDEDYVTIITQCARECALYEREQWQLREEASSQAVLDKGCVVTELSEIEREKFRRAVEPIYECYSQEQQDLIQRIRES